MINYKKIMFFIHTYGFLMMLLSPQGSSSSTDTISIDKPLHGIHTIVSSGGIFELGLFSQGTSNLFYLGIWYKHLNPKTIVWVANRKSPVRYKDNIYLKILNGNLVLQDDATGSVVWSSTRLSTRSRGDDVQAVLLDNGNLVLRNEANSTETVLWQSFDNPSDTWLPGAKLRLDNIRPRTRSKLLVSWNGLEDPSPGLYSLEVDPITRNSLVMFWNGSNSSYWSSGAWDDGLGAFKEVIDIRFNRNLSFEFDVNESYITYSVSEQSPFRLVIDVWGQLRAYNWLEEHQRWHSTWSEPTQKCRVYGHCGPFEICNENSSCECVPNYIKRKSSSSSSVKDSSGGGCIGDNSYMSQCGKRNDNFLAIDHMKLATDPEEIVLKDTPFTTCASACLDYCHCKAYAYDGNRCLTWSSDICNLQQLDANNSEGKTFYLRLTNNISHQGGLGSPEETSRKNKTIVVSVLVPSLAAAGLFISLYRCFSSKPASERAQKDEKQSQEILGGGIIDEEINDEEHMLYLNLQDIMVATNAFSEVNKLGQGGFGPVYKGNLPNGIDVAIKRLCKKSTQGLIEFKNEVVLIIKLQHKNLVKLLGYCVEGDEKLLIYEYMSNKSLDVLLFDPLKSKELDWEKRMKIVIGTTKGLQYLHEDSRLKIIHRDLKASNILLDDEMNPKISDFGTARIFGCKQIDDKTEKIVGTFGYMSPEYALRGMISEKSDIYSFGVLLLEIISGKKATKFNDQNHSLISYAWESWCDTKVVRIVDEVLGDSYSLEEATRCVHISLLCVQDHPNDRPTVSQILYMLSNDHDLPIPKQPTFTNVLKCKHRLVPSDYELSINGVTLSTVAGR